MTRRDSVAQCSDSRPCGPYTSRWQSRYPTPGPSLSNVNYLRGGDSRNGSRGTLILVSTEWLYAAILLTFLTSNIFAGQSNFREVPYIMDRQSIIACATHEELLRSQNTAYIQLDQELRMLK